jgi:hypothetical protein
MASLIFDQMIAERIAAKDAVTEARAAAEAHQRDLALKEARRGTRRHHFTTRATLHKPDARALSQSPSTDSESGESDCEPSFSDADEDLDSESESDPGPTRKKRRLGNHYTPSKKKICS